MEVAVVRVAPRLIAQSNTTDHTYDRLVDRLNRQPTLGVRSSTSVLQQAYSTPIPIANPPFGVVHENGRAKRFELPGNR